MELIDQDAGVYDRDDVLTRTYRHGTETVRVKVRRNFYEFQSSAQASVLNAHRLWTVIAESSPAGWHPEKDGTDRAAVLARVADDLAARAAVILI